MRFEEPDSSRRWDAPLFTVLSEDEHPPYDKIWQSLIEKKAAPPNTATSMVKPLCGLLYRNKLAKPTTYMNSTASQLVSPSLYRPAVQKGEQDK